MKINLQKFIGFGVFVFFVLGCSAINKIQKEVEKTQAPQILTATDGSCQISVPGSWRSETALNNQAILQAAYPLKEQYIVVIRESRKDFGNKANLDFLTKVIRDNLQKSITAPTFSEPVSATVSGYPAKQFEVGGEVQNIKVKYFYAVVETPQNLYQIITWTLASRFDENRPQLLEAINSFKEIGATNPPQPVTGKPAK